MLPGYQVSLQSTASAKHARYKHANTVVESYSKNLSILQDVGTRGERFFKMTYRSFVGNLHSDGVERQQRVPTRFSACSHAPRRRSPSPWTKRFVENWRDGRIVVFESDETRIITYSFAESANPRVSSENIPCRDRNRKRKMNERERERERYKRQKWNEQLCK